jgi:hypothetical protein
LAERHPEYSALPEGAKLSRSYPRMEFASEDAKAEFEIIGGVIDGEYIDPTDEIVEYKITEETEFWLLTAHVMMSYKILYEDFKKTTCLICLCNLG